MKGTILIGLMFLISTTAQAGMFSSNPVTTPDQVKQINTTIIDNLRFVETCSDFEDALEKTFNDVGYSYDDTIDTYNRSAKELYLDKTISDKFISEWWSVFSVWTGQNGQSRYASCIPTEFKTITNNLGNAAVFRHQDRKKAWNLELDALVVKYKDVSKYCSKRKDVFSQSGELIRSPRQLASEYNMLPILTRIKEDCKGAHARSVAGEQRKIDDARKAEEAQSLKVANTISEGTILNNKANVIIKTLWCYNTDTLKHSNSELANQLTTGNTNDKNFIYNTKYSIEQVSVLVNSYEKYNREVCIPLDEVTYPKGGDLEIEYTSAKLAWRAMTKKHSSCLGKLPYVEYAKYKDMPHIRKSKELVLWMKQTTLNVTKVCK